MTTTIAVAIQKDALGARIRELDERLGILRPRLAALHEAIAQSSKKEKHLVRQLAEADGQAKKKIELALVENDEQRFSQEKESQGVTVAIAELEEMRAQIYPEYEQLWREEQKAEHKRKIEEARRAHEADQLAEQAADRKLVEARERSNRSFFFWKAIVEQEILDEQMAAHEKQKEEWGRHSGPNARRVN